MLMQNLGGQRKSIMVFFEVAYTEVFEERKNMTCLLLLRPTYVQK